MVWRLQQKLLFLICGMPVEKIIEFLWLHSHLNMNGALCRKTCALFFDMGKRGVGGRTAGPRELWRPGRLFEPVGSEDFPACLEGENPA
jgi:hypothetical protein